MRGVIVEKIEIYSQTTEAQQFIFRKSQFDNALEAGIRKFISSDRNGQWPLLKAATNMKIEVYSEPYPGNQLGEMDFYIDVKCGSTAQSPSTNQTTSKNTIRAEHMFGKKKLRNPLKVTVYSGATAIVRDITHVPCIIGRPDQGTDDFALSGCQQVSRRHLVLDLIKDDLVLFDKGKDDLGSTNGSYVLGENLDITGRSMKLKLNSAYVVALCLGKTSAQIDENIKSNDRTSFPIITIEYGQILSADRTPEVGGYTPEVGVALGSF